MRTPRRPHRPPRPRPRPLSLIGACVAAAVTCAAVAYRAYDTAVGPAAPAAAVQVSKSEALINAICPGVAN